MSRRQLLIRWDALVLRWQALALVNVVRHHGDDLVLWIHVLLVGGQREVLAVVARSLRVLARVGVVLVVLVVLVILTQSLSLSRAGAGLGGVLPGRCRCGTLCGALAAPGVVVVVDAEGPDEVRLVRLAGLRGRRRCEGPREGGVRGRRLGRRQGPEERRRDLTGLVGGLLGRGQHADRAPRRPRSSRGVRARGVG